MLSISTLKLKVVFVKKNLPVVFVFNKNYFKKIWKLTKKLCGNKKMMVNKLKVAIVKK